jgi:hypothetical protein
MQLDMTILATRPVAVAAQVASHGASKAVRRWKFDLDEDDLTLVTAAVVSAIAVWLALVSAGA